jgi:Carboxypeptidase regulatory-like domain/TonB-dependent Receptor Plug Domain
MSRKDDAKAECFKKNGIPLTRAAMAFPLLSCLLWISLSAGRAQLITTGTINGTVTDSSGAVIPQANIAITNTGTGVVVNTVSNNDGGFSQVGLVVGTYNISVIKTGFQTFNETGIYLGPTAVRTVQAALSPGTTSTNVNVVANAVEVETTNAGLSNQISSEQVSTLPLNGRNFTGLAALMPGVSSSSYGYALGTGGFHTINTLSVNGLGGAGSFYTVDGIDDMESGWNENITVTPNPDEIEQVQVLQNNYDVKYNLQGAAVVIVQTKSGTSAFHGNAWEYLRNTDLAARNYFATTVPVLHWNIFGWDLGGPVYIPGHLNTNRNKLFFYVNEQWVRQDSPVTTTATVPTAAMRSGVFPTTGPFGGTITDPATGLPFPNNTITSDRINPEAKLLLNAFAPLPNNPAGGFTNYNSTQTDLLTQRDDEGKIDYEISSKLRLTAEYLDEVQSAPNVLTFPIQSELTTTNNKLAQVQLTQTFSPRMVNQTSESLSIFLINIGYRGLYLDSQVPGFGIKLPYPDAELSNYLPNVTFASGYAGIGANSQAPLPNANYLNDTTSDDWSGQFGKHLLEAGGSWMFGTNRQDQGAQQEYPDNGSFSFSGRFTGNPIADYLLGDAGTFSQSNTIIRKYMHYVQGTPYFEDHFRAAPNLTLTGGVRLIFAPWPNEQVGYDVSFDPTKFIAADAPIVSPTGVITPTPNYTPSNGLIYNGENGVPLNLSKAHQFYWAPLVGFAWDVYGNGHTSLRGGFSLNYAKSQTSSDCSLSCVAYPLVSNVNLVNVNFSNPSGEAAPTTLEQVLSEDLHGIQAARVSSYSLSLQQQLGANWFFSIAGAGLIGRHVEEFLQQNQSLPVGGYDFNPLINAGTVTAYLNSPYTGYGSITEFASIGNLSWNALELDLRHSIGHGIFFNAAYTWSHELTADNTQFLLNTDYGPQDSYHPNRNYGNSPLNVPQLFTANLIYSIPGFQRASGWKRMALANWQYSVINIVNSGFSTTIGLATANPGLASQPNQVANFKRPKKFSEWFNTANYAAPAPGYFGNVANGSILSPGLINFDMAIYKSFPIHDSLALQFRGEMFNAFNHVNPSTVSEAVGAGNDGQVTAARDPRIGEFALRLNF